MPRLDITLGPAEVLNAAQKVERTPLETELLTALKLYLLLEQANGGLNPYQPRTNRYRAFELGRAAVAKAEAR